jgi:FG-GAP repeat protein
MRGERLLLRVEDEGARYPVTVDPFVQLAELTASDGAAGFLFGFQCAISGNTVVVTSLSSPSFSDHGAAYVFVKPSSGWQDMTQMAELTTSDGAANDFFGDAVGISGNTVVVGALGATIGSNAGQGAAYVFVEPTGGWVNMMETAKLTASDGMANDGFGESVAISGNTIVIGADNAAVGRNSGQGAAYVYTKPGTGWKTTNLFKAKLTASGGRAYDGFGGAVAISGSTIVSGAPQYPPSTGSGAAYVYTKPATGWKTIKVFKAKLTASDRAKDALLGTTLWISGNTIVAGAYNATVRSHVSQGAAYVFVEPAGGWANATQTAKLRPRMERRTIYSVRAFR